MRDEELRDQRPVLNLQGSFSITGLDLSNRRAAWSFDRAANHLVTDKTPIDVVTFRYQSCPAPLVLFELGYIGWTFKRERSAPARLSNGMMLDMSVGTAWMDIDMREVDAVYNGQRNMAELMEAELPEVRQLRKICLCLPLCDVLAPGCWLSHPYSPPPPTPLFCPATSPQFAAPLYDAIDQVMKHELS